MDKQSLREKCPNTELFLVRIFLYSVRIQEKNGPEITPYLDTFHAVGAKTNSIKVDSTVPSVKYYGNNTNRKYQMVNPH